MLIHRATPSNTDMFSCEEEGRKIEKMTRKGCCPKEGINRGAWTSQEDKLLTSYIEVHGLGKWGSLPKNAGLKRCGKSCRLRWLNYLRPDIKRGNITEAEEELIIRLHKLLGNRWSLIARRIPGRTDNEIKNYWNTCLRKKLSGECSKQPRHSNLKKAQAPPGKPSTEKPAYVIQTKAVRCTKLVFPNQDPMPAAFSQTSLYQTAAMTADFQADFLPHSSSPSLQDVGTYGLCVTETVEDSPLLEVPTKSCYVNVDSSSCDGSVFSLADEDNYLKGIFGSEAGQSLSSCFKDGIWDTFMLQ